MRRLRSHVCRDHRVGSVPCALFRCGSTGHIWSFLTHDVLSVSDASCDVARTYNLQYCVVVFETDVSTASHCEGNDFALNPEREVTRAARDLHQHRRTYAATLSHRYWRLESDYIYSTTMHTHVDKKTLRSKQRSKHDNRSPL